MSPTVSVTRGLLTLTAYLDEEDPTRAIVTVRDESGTWSEGQPWDGETLRPTIRGGEWTYDAYGELADKLATALESAST